MNASQRDGFRKRPDERPQASWEHRLLRMVAAGFCLLSSFYFVDRGSRSHSTNEEVKMRYAIVLLTAFVAAACGEAPDKSHIHADRHWFYPNRADR